MKNLFFTFFFILSATHGYSESLIEAKVGYFFFTDAKMQEIYNQGGLDVQLSMTCPLWDADNGWIINGYVAVEYFERSGRSIHGHDKTSIWAIPVNFGLKPTYMITSNLQYYYTLGPRYFYIHQHNQSPYVYKNNSKNGLGYFVNTGFNYLLCDNLAIDFFGEYSYAKTHFHTGKSNVYTRNIQVGGFTFGGGIGYDF